MKQILYFTAAWCGPCRRFGPIMESLGGQMSIRRIDIDANPQIASQYGIRNIPALIFLKDNQIVTKKMGVLSESQVKSIWNQI